MRFEVAGPEHEPALRAMMRASEMPGWVHLSYEHEPDFLRSITAGGRQAQAVAVLAGDQLVGCGYRSWWRASVNGSDGMIGYIGGLRSLERARGGTGLARGYRFLRQLHGDGNTAAYLTTILEDNRAVVDLLTSGRAGLPTYRPLGRYLTRAVLANRRRRPRPVSAEITSAAEVGWNDVASFLAEAGRRRQFGPCPGADDLVALADLGLGADRFLLATTGGGLRACAALWDVSAFRQQVVRGYGGLLGPMRGPASVALRALGYRGLPVVGEQLRLPFVAFVASVDDDPDPLAALFERFQQLCVAESSHGFVAGFHAGDPLAASLGGFVSLTYPSLVYLVHWDDGQSFADALDTTLTPYLEPALL